MNCRRIIEKKNKETLEKVTYLPYFVNVFGFFSVFLHFFHVCTLYNLLFNDQLRERLKINPISFYLFIFIYIYIYSPFLSLTGKKFLVVFFIFICFFLSHIADVHFFNYNLFFFFVLIKTLKCNTKEPKLGFVFSFYLF